MKVNDVPDKYRIDSTKIQFHPEWVTRWRNADTWEKAKKVIPLYWEITTSAACGHRCLFCSVDAIGYPAILMDSKILMDRMREGQRLGVKSVMFAGTGEPLLHKEINRITESAVHCGLDAAFTTNGVLLDKLETLHLCQWVKISLNAGSRENYAHIHQTKAKDWDKVWSNIRDASKRKGNCTLGVQCVVLPDNRKEMPELAAMARDAGADYLVLKPYSVGTFQSHEPIRTNYREWDLELQLIPERYDSDGFKVIYRAEAMKQESEKHHYDKCRATPSVWTYSMGNGDMFSCSAHLMNESFNIGNLYKQNFQEIWEGEGRRKNWEMMRSFDIAQCRLNCRQNQTNIYLDQLVRGIPHQNFV